MCVRIIRKRIIPSEEVDISADELLQKDENVIITRWFPIKPRNDIGWGISLIDLKENYKISAFYNRNGEFLYWYCDIINVTYISEIDTYVVKDLLVDIRMYPDNVPEILDLDELELAFRNGLIEKNEYCLAIKASLKVVSMLKDEIPLTIMNILKYGPPKGFNPT